MIYTEVSKLLERLLKVFDSIDMQHELMRCQSTFLLHSIAAITCQSQKEK